MVGLAIVADEEALVVVGPRRLVNGGMPLDARVDREIPDIALVQAEPHLLFERHGVKFPRGLERGVDQIRRHAVPREVEEADTLARVLHLPCDLVDTAGLPGERGPEVDHRNRPRGFLDALYGP